MTLFDCENDYHDDSSHRHNHNNHSSCHENFFLFWVILISFFLHISCIFLVFSYPYAIPLKVRLFHQEDNSGDTRFLPHRQRNVDASNLGSSTSALNQHLLLERNGSQVHGSSWKILCLTSPLSLSESFDIFAGYRDFDKLRKGLLIRQLPKVSTRERNC